MMFPFSRGQDVFLSFILCLIFLVLAAFNTSSKSLTVFDPRDYGAIGDGKHDDTDAIRATFAAVGKLPAGESAVVLFKNGFHFLTGPFNLTSNTIVSVESGASILGIQDESRYPIIAPLPSYGKSRDVGYTRYEPLVHAVNVKNVRLTGDLPGFSSFSGGAGAKKTTGGVIDGQGSYWWAKWPTHLSSGRPRLVEFMWSDGIEVDHLTLNNSGFWTLHPVYSSNIHLHDLVIRAPPHAPNTDGIDPDSSANVMIERVDILCGDDDIAIKSGLDDPGLSYNWPTKNVTIRDSVFRNGGGVAIGSETSGGISDVYIHDCVAVGPVGRGAYIKTSRGRGGVIERIKYENLVFEKVGLSSIVIDMYYSKEPPTHNATTTPIVRDIFYRNLTGGSATETKYLGYLHCLPESPCDTGIVVEEVSLKARAGWSCEDAKTLPKDVCPESRR